MKLVLRKTMPIAIGALAFALAASANAQTSRMRMEIPFPFLAGNETHPAGTYRVTVDEELGRLLIEPQDNSGALLLRLSMGTSERKQSMGMDGMLQFRKYGERYVLRAAFRPGRGEGHTLPPSKAERELAVRFEPTEIAAVASRR